MENKPFTATFAYVLTTAPSAYDYAMTYEIPTDSVNIDRLSENSQYALFRARERGEAVRTLLVDAGRLDNQVDRFMSGSYLTIVVGHNA